MKLTLRKILTVLPVALLAILFTGVMISCSNDSGSDNGLALLLGGNKQTSPNKEKPAEEVTEPVFNTRTEALDFIFGTDKLASTKITITRGQWNKLLEYYDINDSNEECVHAEYRFEKDGKAWTMKDVGFRIRGNTSRTRPQDEESEKYVQAHFKVDFEEWPVIVDGVETAPDRKLENCMKGVILKRFKDDFTYSREIFGYNYFRDCGVWTAPRAGYTRLLLDIVEEDGSIEKVDYGVYAMIENIDKQFLKERTSEEKGGDFNGNKGNLWKCTWKNGSGPNFKNDYEDYYFGVEEIKLDPSEPSSEYNYDLKTNKDKLSKAKTEIKGWINELNSLNDSDSSAIKAWYEEKMDVDLFLKTYAVNVILGMWDDYWINNNNYYFYFDKDGKAYFIPYDYDNILGTNGCSTDAAKKNPLEWGNLNDVNHPLIQKIMKVPEFVNKYKEYLIQFSNAESGFDYTKASEKIRTWQNMIKDYIGATAYTDGVCKLAWENTKSSFEDVVADWSDPYVPYKLLSGDDESNYFKVRQKCIKNSLKTSNVTFNFNGGECTEYPGDYVVVGVENVTNLENLIQVKKDGYRFCGWTKTLDGTDYVKTVSEDTELYASWVEENIIPYVYIPASKKYKIIFRPEHFGFNKETYDGSIKFVCDGTDWETNPLEMTKDEETGWHYVEVTNLGGWNGFKFYNDGNWYGYEVFNQKQLPELFAQHEPNYNFIIPELK